MKRARFVAAARREFLAEVAYYHTQETGLGARFAAAVEAATARVLAFPFSGAPASKITRRIFVRGFPFTVVYRPEPDGILIVALAHPSRRPEYWQLRVQEPSATYAPGSSSHAMGGDEVIDYTATLFISSSPAWMTSSNWSAAKSLSDASHLP